MADAETLQKEKESFHIVRRAGAVTVSGLADEIRRAPRERSAPH